MSTPTEDISPDPAPIGDPFDTEGILGPLPVPVEQTVDDCEAPTDAEKKEEEDGMRGDDPAQVFPTSTEKQEQDWQAQGKDFQQAQGNECGRGGYN